MKYILSAFLLLLLFGTVLTQAAATEGAQGSPPEVSASTGTGQGQENVEGGLSEQVQSQG